MDIIITGRHFDVSSSLKDHVHEKFKKIERHASDIDQIHVRLILENKISHKAEATFNTSKGPIVAQCKTDDMYASVEKLVEKIDRQLIDKKTQAKEHGEHIAYS